MGPDAPGQAQRRGRRLVLDIERAIDEAQIEGPKQTNAFDKFFEETINREDGRRGRLEEAEGVVPSPMWLVLFLGAGCLVGLVLLYGDRTEKALVQCAQAGAITALVVTSLLLVDFLDHPYRNGAGSIKPTSMTFAVRAMEHELPSAATPCDASHASSTPFLSLRAIAKQPLMPSSHSATCRELLDGFCFRGLAAPPADLRELPSRTLSCTAGAS